jgi:hypothetical protein
MTTIQHREPALDDVRAGLVHRATTMRRTPSADMGRPREARRPNVAAGAHSAREGAR